MVGSGVVRVGSGVSTILAGTGAGVSKTDVVVGCEHTVGAATVGAQSVGLDPFDLPLLPQEPPFPFDLPLFPPPPLDLPDFPVAQGSNITAQSVGAQSPPNVISREVDSRQQRVREEMYC